MRLTLVIPSLRGGGAERVMATMANFWARRGWPVTLLTFDDGREPPFYALDPAVTRHPLGLAQKSGSSVQGVANNLRRAWILRRAVAASRPDVVVSFMDQTNVLVLLATRALRLPVVVAEHSDPAQQRLSWSWEKLRRLIYPQADAIVMLSDAAKSYFPPHIQERVRVVPNPVVVDRVVAGRPSDPPPVGPTLIAVGRLSQEKGFDLLLEAFALVAPSHPAWRLTIWGEGTLRGDLERLRDDLGLRERVALPGATGEIHQRMEEADLFVLSSRYEGFPMALCEAMALGLPVVSFDCPSGPRQIVRPGVDGLLVPAADVGALAESLDLLMGDPAERHRLAANAPAVLERFGLERVMAVWDDLLREARG